MNRIFLGFLLSLIYFGVYAQNVPMYVGTYTSNGSPGVHVYDFDEASGKPTFVQFIEMSNPSFLAKSGSMLYAVNEDSNGAISAVDLSSTKILNHLPTNGAHPCHVSVSPTEPIAIASNYSGGSLVLFSLNTDGSLKEQEDYIHFEKSSVDEKRQSTSHIHSAFFTQDGSFLFVCDLGADLIYKIAIEKDSNGYKMNLVEEISTKLGGGPRHLLISKDMERLYVILELTGEIQLLEKSNNAWVSKLVVPMFKPDFVGLHGGADIKMSKDGKFVYATNRGTANQLIVYKVKSDDGSLSAIQVLSVAGDSPRNVQLSPNEKWVIVSNQLTGNLSFFSRNRNGKLVFNNNSLAIPSAVCVIF